MQTRFTQKLRTDFPPQSVRSLLQTWLIPRKWQHFLRCQEKVRINGTYRHFNELVHAGDIVQLDFDFLPETSQYYQPCAGHLPILYEDDTTVVVNKPAGLKTHPNQPDETGTVMNILQAQLQQVPLMVHRLDQQTSGALLVAKTPVVVPIYNRQLTQQIMRRDYLAWVEAGPEPLPDSGQIKLPIGQDPHDRRKRRVDFDQGQVAWTDYQVLARQDKRILVELQLHTGRTHQIRVHLAAIGHSICHDPLYQAADQKPMQLHGYRLNFQHPFSHQNKTVLAPPPAYFDKPK